MSATHTGGFVREEVFHLNKKRKRKDKGRYVNHTDEIQLIFFLLKYFI
jgi:hypothetical protein